VTNAEAEPHTDDGSFETRGEHTRRVLIHAAVDVIAEHGWSGLTTRAVSRRAGVNPALVHYHFGSVSALGREAAAQAMGAVFLPTAAHLLNTDDLLDGLEAAIATTLELDTGAPEPRVMVEAFVRAIHDVQLTFQFRDAVEQFRRLLAVRVAGARRERRLPASSDPVGTATLVAALLDGLTLHHLLDPKRDLSSVAPALRAMLEAP
jgi:AcrR family transcriptional regulator